MKSRVDAFFENMSQWQKEAKILRKVLAKTDLQEALKWNLPCYALDGANVVIIQPFKSCLALMFFKGALLKDQRQLFVANGPNSRSSKRLEFRSRQDIAALESSIKSYVKEAIAIEKSGLKVELTKKPLLLPHELKEIFAQQPALKRAFASLTPGRKRVYLLYFSSAKQSTTRLSRIKKCSPRILKGKGLHDPSA